MSHYPRPSQKPPKNTLETKSVRKISNEEINQAIEKRLKKENKKFRLLCIIAALAIFVVAIALIIALPPSVSIWVEVGYTLAVLAGVPFAVLVDLKHNQATLAEKNEMHSVVSDLATEFESLDLNEITKSWSFVYLGKDRAKKAKLEQELTDLQQMANDNSVDAKEASKKIQKTEKKIRKVSHKYNMRLSDLRFKLKELSIEKSQ